MVKAVQFDAKAGFHVLSSRSYALDEIRGKRELSNDSEEGRFFRQLHWVFSYPSTDTVFLFRIFSCFAMLFNLSNRGHEPCMIQENKVSRN